MPSIKLQNTRIPLKVEAAERRTYALRLKKTDATWREIAAAVIQHYGIENVPKGYDERYAYNDVKRALEYARAELRMEAINVRDLELERVAEMISRLYPRALGRPGRGTYGTETYLPEVPPDLKAIDRIIKLMERRAKLLGLDEPDRIDLNSAKPMIIKLLSGVSMDDL